MTDRIAARGSAELAPGVVAIDGAELDADVRALAQQPNFAAVSTLLSGGQPQTQLTWIDVDSSHLLVNTLPFVQKSRNVARDSRITVLIIDRNDPEHYAEVRGRVVRVTEGPVAVEHADRLTRCYLGSEYRGPTQRMIYLLSPVARLSAEIRGVRKLNSGRSRIARETGSRVSERCSRRRWEYFGRS